MTSCTSLNSRKRKRTQPNSMSSSSSSSDKTVRFKDKVRVRRVPTRGSMSAALKSELWVSKEEILKQAQGCKRNFHFLKLGLKKPNEIMIEDVSKLYLDGLESSQEKSMRHKRMFRAMQSVLDEQTRMWKEQQLIKTANTTDAAPFRRLHPLEIEAQIAVQYSKYAAESATLALERGRNQAKLQSDDDTDVDVDTQEENETADGKSRGRQSILNRLKGTARRSPKPPLRRSPQPRQERQHR